MAGGVAKHLAYDFYHHCLHHKWVKPMQFEHFSEMLEKGWVSTGSVQSLRTRVKNTLHNMGYALEKH